MGALGIIAGRGELPVAIAKANAAEGRDVFILSLKGFEEPRLAEFPGVSVGLGEIGKSLKALKAAKCTDVTFAGIVTRPDFSDLKLDMRGARLLPKVLAAARKGDDALLRVLVDTFEQEGFRVIGSADANRALLAPIGQIAGTNLSDSQRNDIALGARIAAEIGRLDIGQGCVVCDGLVLAVEAQEGTDAMLARVADLPAPLRGEAGDRKGVLLKRPKPIQERRIDLPTAGLSTMQGIEKAGLAGLAIEGEGALLLDRAAMIDFAHKHGLFIYGFEPGLSL